MSIERKPFSLDQSLLSREVNQRLRGKHCDSRMSRRHSEAGNGQLSVESDTSSPEDPDASSLAHRTQRYQEVLAMGWKLQETDSRKTTIAAAIGALESRKCPQLPLPAPVSAVAVTPTAVVLGLYDGGVLATAILSPAALLQSSSPHLKQVTVLRTVPETTKVVSVSADRTLKLWDVATHSEVVTFKGHTRRITCVTVTADSRFAVSGGRDHLVKVWDLLKGTEAASFDAHLAPVTCIAATSDGKMAISGSADGALRLWSLTQFAECGVLPGHSNSLSAVEVIEGDGFCVSVAYRDLSIWSLRECCEVRTLQTANAISGLVLIPDSPIVFASGNCLKIWTKLDTAPSTLAKFPEVITAVSTCGNRDLLLLHFPKGIKLWSLEDECEAATLVEYGDGAGDHVYCPSATADGRWLVYETNMTLKAWSLLERREKQTLANSATAGNGKFVVTQTPDLQLKVIDFGTNTHRAVATGHKSEVLGLVVAQRCLHFVSWTLLELTLWRSADLTPLATTSEPLENVKSVAVTADEAACFVLTLKFGESGTLYMWRLDGPKDLVTLREFSVNGCFSLTADCKFCVLRTRSEVYFWDAAGEKETIVPTEDSGVRCVVSTTADSRWAVVGFWNAVQLWSFESMVAEWTLEGHSGAVTCVAQHQRTVITGADDCTLKVWSLVDRSEVSTFVGHSTAIDCVSITADGGYCLSADTDSVRVWSLRDLRELAVLQRSLEIVDSIAATPDFRYFLTWSSSWFNSLSDSKVDLSPLSLPTIALTPRGPVSDELISNLAHFRTGVLRSKRTASECFSPYRLNGLHISAYYNQAEQCRNYLDLGVPAIRGEFGSPLTVALRRNAGKAVDAILQFFIDSFEKNGSDKDWAVFECFTEDLPELLRCKSAKVEELLGVVMQPSAQSPPLPQFLTPYQQLPIAKHLATRCISLGDFEAEVPDESNEQSVHFSLSLFRWNVAAGSSQSLQLLRAIADSKDPRVLLTPYVSLLIAEKWSATFPVRVLSAAVLGLLFFALILIEFDYCQHFAVYMYVLLVSGCALLYESVRTAATDRLRALSLLRPLATIAWAAGLHAVAASEWSALVFALWLLAGFSQLRCLQSTRHCLRFTSALVKELSSFLLVLVYLATAGGLLVAVLRNREQWVLAGFQPEGLQWTVAAAAVAAFAVLSVVNAAFSETHDQSESATGRAKEMLVTLIEYEEALFWRRNAGTATVLSVCASDTDPTPLKRANLQKPSKSHKEELRDMLKTVETRIATVEDSLLSVEDHTSEIDSRIADIQSKLATVLDVLQQRALSEQLSS